MGIHCLNKFKYVYAYKPAHIPPVSFTLTLLEIFLEVTSTSKPNNTAALDSGD